MTTDLTDATPGPCEMCGGQPAPMRPFTVKDIAKADKPFKVRRRVCDACAAKLEGLDGDKAMMRLIATKVSRETYGPQE